MAAKLTLTDIKNIRAADKDGIPRKHQAVFYNVSTETIARACRGDTWTVVAKGKSPEEMKAEVEKSLAEIQKRLERGEGEADWVPPESHERKVIESNYGAKTASAETMRAAERFTGKAVYGELAERKEGEGNGPKNPAGIIISEEHPDQDASDFYKE